MCERGADEFSDRDERNCSLRRSAIFIEWRGNIYAAP